MSNDEIHIASTLRACLNTAKRRGNKVMLFRAFAIAKGYDRHVNWAVKAEYLFNHNLMTLSDILRNGTLGMPESRSSSRCWIKNSSGGWEYVERDRLKVSTKSTEIKGGMIVEE